MYFNTKSYLKNNRYYTTKQSLTERLFFFLKARIQNLQPYSSLSMNE